MLTEEANNLLFKFEFKEAEELSRKILKKHPFSVAALVTLAIVLVHTGEEEEVLELYKKAFEIIASNASDGDLINGGHIDFPSVRKSIQRKSKIITLLREPAARCRSEYEYCRNAYLRSNPLRRIDSSARNKAAGKYNFDGFLDFLLD